MHAIPITAKGRCHAHPLGTLAVRCIRIIERHPHAVAPLIVKFRLVPLPGTIDAGIHQPIHAWLGRDTGRTKRRFLLNDFKAIAIASPIFRDFNARHRHAHFMMHGNHQIFLVPVCIGVIIEFETAPRAKPRHGRFAIPAPLITAHFFRPDAG